MVIGAMGAIDNCISPKVTTELKGIVSLMTFSMAYALSVPLLSQTLGAWIPRPSFIQPDSTLLQPLNQILYFNEQLNIKINNFAQQYNNTTVDDTKNNTTPEIVDTSKQELTLKDYYNMVANAYNSGRDSLLVADQLQKDALVVVGEYQNNVQEHGFKHVLSSVVQAMDSATKAVFK